MAGLNGIVIRFFADTGSAVRNVNKLEHAMGRTIPVSKRLSTVWEKALKPAAIAVGAAAGAAALKFGIDGVKAFVEDDAAAQHLTKTLDNLGEAQDTDKVEAYIDTLSKATGIADDNLRPAFEKLVIATGSAETAMRLMSTAVDASVGSGKDLESVAAAIAKGLGPKGTLGALKRLIPSLDTSKIKAGDLAGIMQVLDQTYGGQAAARMDTYAGKWDALVTSFGELEESFGRGLLTNLQGTDGVMGTMDDTLYTLGPAVEQLGANLATVLTTIGDIITLIDTLPDPPDWLMTALEYTNPVTLVGKTTSAAVEGLQTAGVIPTDAPTTTPPTPPPVPQPTPVVTVTPEQVAASTPVLLNPTRDARRTQNADATAAARGAKSRKDRTRS